MQTFSGVNEPTAFNVNAINAIIRIGFKIKKTTDTVNPIYHLYFDETEKPIECFSKVYNDDVNPKNEFAAIMTCSDAEENCPFIAGVELRIWQQLTTIQKHLTILPYKMLNMMSVVNKLH